MTLPQNNVSAIVLSGGGAHGAYEVGVLKALLTGASWTTGNVPLDPYILTGTSIGAYNAAVLMSRLEVEGPVAVAQYLEDVWLNLIPGEEGAGHNHVYRFRGNPLEFFRLDALVRAPLQLAAAFGQDAMFFAQDWLQRGVNFFASPGTLAQRSLGLVDLSTLISRAPAEQLLRKTIVLENLRRSPRLLFLAVTNWKTGGPEFFRKNDMTEENGYQAILASSAIPGVFPPVAIGGNVYVDGGLRLNTPLAPAFVEAQPGADTAHIIYLDPETETIPLQPLQSTIGTLDRLITISLSNSIEAEMRTAHRVNRGLLLLEKSLHGKQITKEDLPDLIQSASYLIEGIGGRLPDSPKTIHRYRPSHYLGGAMSLLNFNRARMRELMDMGFDDVMNHDCKASKCVLPEGMQERKEVSLPRPAVA